MRCEGWARRGLRRFTYVAVHQNNFLKLGVVSKQFYTAEPIEYRFQIQTLIGPRLVDRYLFLQHGRIGCLDLNARLPCCPRQDLLQRNIASQVFWWRCGIEIGRLRSGDGFLWCPRQSMSRRKIPCWSVGLGRLGREVRGFLRHRVRPSHRLSHGITRPQHSDQSANSYNFVRRILHKADGLNSGDGRHTHPSSHYWLMRI